MARPVILIIDDDPGVHEMLAEVLSDEGYDVVGALNGREGLGRVRDRLPDVVLVDLMMPIMDGWEFCEELRRVDGGVRIPVLVLSAAHGVGDAARQVCADGYIAKPFDLVQLLAKLADCVARPRV